MQVANDGNAPPAPDQAYLDTVLDGLVAFVDASSYGRAVLAIDVAGTDPATANRWYRTGLSPEKANYAGLLVPGDTPRPLDDYEIISTFATNSGHSVEVTCNNIGTVASKSCNIVYAYRRPDLAPFAMDVHHENGHSLRLAHDRAFSSLTGYGPTRSTFQGEWQPYGGRSSVMGTATDAAYNLQERVSAGWLNDGISGAGRHVVSVTSGSVTTTIDELEQDVEGIKGVYVPVTGGNYWIETRRDPSLEPILQTGVILHFASDAGSHFGGMIDGTPETPADALVDGTLPIGRTFADTANHVYITALSQTATTTKVQVERDPADPNPPVIASVEAIDCATQPTKCPNLPPTAPGLGLWRFQVTASDADGDALSHAWRFGVGTNGVADATSYQAGAAVYRWQRVGAAPIRAFVTVSDRKGGEASGFVNQPGYRSVWVAPAISGLAVVPVQTDDVPAANQFVAETSADPTGTELLDYAWTVDGVTSMWPRPIFAPAPSRFESVPACIAAELRLTDTTNCSAEPTRCTATLASSCIAPALRLTSTLDRTTTPPSYRLVLTADTAALKVGSSPTYKWISNCAVTVMPWHTQATMPAFGACTVSVTVDGNRKTFAATLTP